MQKRQQICQDYLKITYKNTALLTSKDYLIVLTEVFPKAEIEKRVISYFQSYEVSQIDSI